VDDESLLDALHNETSRKILQYTSEIERSADELAELIDVTPTTVYRKLDVLESNDLVAESLQLDRDGNHYSVYHATIDHVDVDISEERLRVEVSRNEAAADTFTRMWEGVRGDR
jgi:DNA-binding transcriptional ArsR family regulator